MVQEKDSSSALKKALDVISEAERRGVRLRLIGGMAFAYLAPKASSSAALSRKYNDIDFVALKSQSGEIAKLLQKLGFEPNERFNALHGYDRLQYFYGSMKVDIFLDEFRMCHYIDLRDRLALSEVTIPQSDLLLTKLQIFELNEKDMKDVLALLSDLSLGNADTPRSIDAGYIANLLSNDWGFYKTVTMNIGKLKSYAASLKLDAATARKVSSELDYLASAIELKPKTVRWKLRARIGEKVRWYELPEEVQAAPPQKAPMSATVYEWLSFDDMRKIAEGVAGKIMRRYGKPSAILYIERGGMIFAQMLGDMLGVSELHGIQVISYEDLNRQGRRTYVLPHYISIGSVAAGGYVLVVDDIADTGRTLSIVLRMFAKKFRRVVSATMVYKPRSLVKPDIIGKEVSNNTWIVFDYEENEALESFRKNNVQYGISMLEAKKAYKSAEYAKMKAELKNAAARLGSEFGAPDAIVYSHSGSMIARLISDYLSVKRVVGVGDSAEACAAAEARLGKLLGEPLGRGSKGYVLVVGKDAGTAERICHAVAATARGAKIVTLSMRDDMKASFSAYKEGAAKS